MTEKEIEKLRELRALATNSCLLLEEDVQLLRYLENRAAVEFAKKHGLILHC